MSDIIAETETIAFCRIQNARFKLLHPSRSLNLVYLKSTVRAINGINPSIAIVLLHYYYYYTR